MKTRLITAFSVALNLALAAAILLAPRKMAAPVQAALAAPVAPETNSPAPIKTPAMPTAPLRWDQIAADDLKIYRDNLRAIGCPELTVQEIIRAVINENFGARRRGLLAPVESQYWNLVLRGELHRRQRLPQTEWGKALTALADERQELISEVLGQDALASEAVRQARQAESEQRRSWLPADKRNQLAELEARHQQQLADWSAGLNQHPGSPPTPQDESRLQQIQTDFAAAEKRLLTPTELAELKLRESDVAGWAASLPGFNPTEDEWRSLTQLRAQFEESQNALTSPELADETRAARQNELATSFDDAVKAALAPDRLAQYQLANNAEYQSLHAVAQRYGLGDDLVNQGLDIQQTARNMADQVRTSPNLSPADQQTTLNTIQHETGQTLSQILGPSVFATYQEYGGDWFPGLVQTNQN
jgi:hypothetical protein